MGAAQTSLSSPKLSPALELLLELSDDRLILGHRISEWCGHAPMLEEDIALANVALDLLGHATNGLTIVATALPNASADSLAFLRDPQDFKNLQLVEQPNDDFAYTMVRQFLFDAYQVPLLEILSDESNHGNSDLAGWAAKCLKENLYHLRRSTQWILRLGDGTAESHQYAQEALDNLWRFTGELITPSPALKTLLSNSKVATKKLEDLENRWKNNVSATLTEATLQMPSQPMMMLSGGRIGHHTEHLSKILAIMQVLPRAHPGASW